MVRALFTGWTGMRNEQQRLDVISNNLANSATVGFKKESVSSQSFKDVLTVKIRDTSESLERPIGKMTPGVKLGEIFTDYTQSSLRQTGNTFDMAIEGDGFFQVAVMDKNGNTSLKYTRAGEFTTTNEGYVVDINGNQLMSEGGELQIPPDAREIIIDESGYVLADGKAIDKLIVKNFEDYNYLKKYGETKYETVDGAKEIDSNAKIRQGFTEQSNVNIVAEMVEMIAITRAYEANQKVIQSIDSTLELSVNSIGKI